MSSIGPNEADRLVKVIAEQGKRQLDALRLYRPMPTQSAFHRSFASERLVRGGNRCLGGEQEIYDPVAGVSRRVDQITGEFHVWCRHAKTGKRIIAKASRPFIKGHGSLYRVSLSNGESFIATKEHLLLSADGWRSVSACEPMLGSVACPLVTSSGTCPPKLLQDADRSSQTPSDFPVSYSPGHRQCDEQLQSLGVDGQEFSLQSVDADERNRCYSSLGDSESERERSRIYRHEFRPSILCVPARSSGLAVAFGNQIAYTLCSRPWHSPQALFRSPRRLAGQSRTTASSARPAIRFASVGASGCPSYSNEKSHSKLSISVAERSSSHRSQADKGGNTPAGRCNTESQIAPSVIGGNNKVCITSVNLHRQGDIWDFEVYRHHNYEIAGVYSHNSGKSSCCFAELAHAATGIPLIDYDGTPIPDKYPRNRGPLMIWVIGYGIKHISSPIHRMLFTPGTFSIIQDKVTGKWRAWRPWLPEDAAREDEIRPAPPLIPPRLIAGWAWENKAERVFTQCHLANGNEIHAFTSNASPKQGDPVDLIHIDEDIEFQHHVPEWQARLSDRKGRLTWAAFPHGKNSALTKMTKRAEEQKNLAKPDIEEYVLRFSDNPFIDQNEKRKRREGWSDEEIRARDYGEYITDTVLVYPNYSESLHCCPPRDAARDDAIDAILRNRGLQPPKEWTRYLALDPGHAVNAVLFAAVPPPEFGDYVVIYDELHLKRADAKDVAREIRRRVEGQEFEAFIIDLRASRQTPLGFNLTIGQQYTNAFTEVGVRSNQTGHGFLRSSDNIMGGIGLVRDWMHIRNDGTCKIKIVREKTPLLRDELINYRKRVIADAIMDEPVERNCDLLACLRYLASHRLEYTRPRGNAQSHSPAYRGFLEMQKLMNKNQSSATFMGPGVPV